MEKVTVLVKSALWSKINWTQAIGVAAQVLIFFGIVVPPDLQAQAAVLAAALQGFITYILRTYFTTELTKASAEGMPAVK